MTTVVNLKHEAFDVRIDRTSPYGNPFLIGRDGNRYAVIDQHMALWRSRLANPALRVLYIARLQHMKGKRLGCHCKPHGCHGDNYVKLIAEFCG